MTQTIAVPRRVIYDARIRLMRAEAVVAAMTSLGERIAAAVAPRPAARGSDAINIARAWLQASA